MEENSVSLGTVPNNAVERTGKKLALFPRRSPPAFGCFRSTGGGKMQMTGERREQPVQQGEHHAHRDRQGPR
jgi:hypothetical protein